MSNEKTHTLDVHETVLQRAQAYCQLNGLTLDEYSSQLVKKELADRVVKPRPLAKVLQFVKRIR